ncbi:hypothetical protein ACQKLN_02230, partial [Paenibacillus glucanolyticus]|uniref:hypothetical protein n=1 Tax=Paenibacillus glucanolyticus TaxID=59843 RepID=UPI003D01AB5A
MIYFWGAAQTHDLLFALNRPILEPLRTRSAICRESTYSQALADTRSVICRESTYSQALADTRSVICRESTYSQALADTR